jgi:hypothetical protein
MGTASRLQAIMSNRKHPSTANQLADRIGVSSKTIQNNLSSGEKLDQWLPDGKVVLAIRNRKTGERRYMLSNRLSVGTGDTVKVGKRNYSVLEANVYRISLTN